MLLLLFLQVAVAVTDSSALATGFARRPGGSSSGRGGVSEQLFSEPTTGKPDAPDGDRQPCSEKRIGELPSLEARPTKETPWKSLFSRVGDQLASAMEWAQLPPMVAAFEEWLWSQSFAGATSDQPASSRQWSPPSKRGPSKAPLAQASHSTALLLAEEHHAASSSKDSRWEQEPAKKAAPAEKPSRLIYGMPKLAWAIICDVLAMLLVILCVPLLLACSKRRPPGQSMFSFSEPPVMYDQYQGMDWPPNVKYSPRY